MLHRETTMSTRHQNIANKHVTHHTRVTILTKMATFAPSLLHMRAIALPIPRPAPVTMTRWPANRGEDTIMEFVMCSVEMMMSRIESNNISVMECSRIS